MVTKPHRSFTAILLGLFFIHLLSPLILPLSSFIVRQQQQSIIKSFTASDKVFTKVALNDISVISSEKEFTVNGILYDIKSIQKENGKYVALGLCDKKETTINKIAASQLGKNLKQTHKDKVTLFTFLFYQEPVRWALTTSYALPLYNSYCSPLSTCHLSVTTPPPQSDRLS